MHLLSLLFDDSLGCVPFRGLLLGLDAGIQHVSVMRQAVHHPAGHLAAVHATRHQSIHCLCHDC